MTTINVALAAPNVTTTISVPGMQGTPGAVQSITLESTGGTINVSGAAANAGNPDGSFNIDLPAVGSAGTYGSSTTIPILTTDAYGRVTGVTTETIASVAVSSITGTAHQVIASASYGAITLSLPQSIDTSSSPSFAGLNVTAGAANLIVIDTSGYTPTSGNPQGVLFRNSNIYSNLVTYGSGGWMFESTGVDNDQPKVFIQDNVSSTSLGNSAWLELVNVAGNGTSNPNLVTTTAIGGSIEMIAPMEAVGALCTVTITNGGTGYANGTYTAVPLTTTTGHGQGATATVVVSGGIVTSVTVTGYISATQGGSGANYSAIVGAYGGNTADTLSASNTNLGGSGSGLVLTVASVVYYNGKLKINVVSGITGSTSIYADGYFCLGPRRSTLSTSGANTGFEPGLTFTAMSTIGQGWLVSPGSGFQCTPAYNYGVPSQISLVNAFQSSNFTNIAETASGTSATIENWSTGASGTSYIRTKTSTGGASVYCETDDSASGSSLIARSAWGGTPGTTSYSRLALLTDNSSADSGWYIDTVGTGGATPNVLNFKTRTAGTQATVATMTASGAWTANTYNGQTISSATSLTGTFTVASTSTFNGALIVQSATNPQVTIKNTANSQIYQFGYNLSATMFGIYNATINSGVGAWAFEIADATNAIKLPSNIASTSPTSGTLVVTGGAGFSGAGWFGGAVNSTGVNVTGSGASLVQTTTGDVTSGGSVYHRFNDVNGNAGYVGFGGTNSTFVIQNYKNGYITINTNGATALTLNPDLSAKFGGITQRTVGTGLTAAGTTQGTALALTKEINEVTTCASGAGVVMPSYIGATFIISNQGANACLVYPVSSAAIDALGTNVAFSLDVGARVMFVQISATQYRTLNATYA